MARISYSTWQPYDTQKAKHYITPEASRLDINLDKNQYYSSKSNWISFRFIQLFYFFSNISFISVAFDDAWQIQARRENPRSGTGSGRLTDYLTFSF
jgi:hypothetical protein